MSETGNPISAERETPWQGLFWPLTSILGGLIAYFLLFGLLVDPLNPAPDAMRNAEYSFIWEADPPPSQAAVLAADQNARYAMAIPTVLMSLSFAATLILAFSIVLPTFGRAAIGLGVIAMPIGGVIGYFEQYSNPIRAAVANCDPASGATFCPLDQAMARAGDLGTFTESSLAQIKLLTDWNSVISAAAIFLLGICFLFIARRASNAELIPSLLRARRRALNTTMILGGLVLVFSVATAHAFHHIAPALMAKADATPFAGLALAGSSYWGAAYTTVLIVVASPAMVSITADVQRASVMHGPDADYAARQEWRQRHGLSVDLKDTAGPLIASLTPVLTAPALNMLKPFLVGS